MNFVDRVDITLISGKGGDGRVSFRRERYIDKGGPNGGNGGNGGNIVLQASFNQNSLANYRHNKVHSAENGLPGGNNNKTGRRGQDLILKVPVGTCVFNQANQLLADLATDQQMAVIVQGGRGGFGNAHFISSTRQAPNFAEKGEPSISLDVRLELKLLADVGLVGLPNVGKSTLLRSISNAKPEVADYPFTTLKPSVGVVDIDNQGTKSSLLFADIPGLIEGASLGKGLGQEFLKHIERTKVIVHLLSAYSSDIVKDYVVVRNELKSYSLALAKKPEIVVLNKTEGLTDSEIANLKTSLKPVLSRKSTKIIAISALAHLNLKELITESNKIYLKKQQVVSRQAKSKLYTYQLSDQSVSKVKKIKKGQYEVSLDDQLYHFALRTDFNNPEAVQRLVNIFLKKGLMHRLYKLGLKTDDLIIIKDVASFKFF